MALINDPKILLLDEPFAALDILTIKMLQEIILICSPLRKFLLQFVITKQEIFLLWTEHNTSNGQIRLKEVPMKSLVMAAKTHIS